jgi:hypothetical protein
VRYQINTYFSEHIIALRFGADELVKFDTRNFFAPESVVMEGAIKRWAARRKTALSVRPSSKTIAADASGQYDLTPAGIEDLARKVRGFCVSEFAGNG